MIETTEAVPTETAVIVPVPELEVAVADHRRRLDVAATWGVGAHVSVIYPFAAPADVDAALIARLAVVLRSVDAFPAEFERCEWFGDEVLWLAPEPAQPFRNLTAAVWREFSQYPPYGGAYDDVVPHLTVGERRRGSAADLQDAEVAVSACLPIRAHIDRAVLIAGAPEPDSWRTVHEFPLGPSEL